MKVVRQYGLVSRQKTDREDEVKSKAKRPWLNDRWSCGLTLKRG